MDSLVGYGSDDENESERYGGHLSSVGGAAPAQRRRDDDTNYDDVNMDMSEDSQEAESEPELPPAEPAPAHRDSQERRGSGKSHDSFRGAKKKDSRSRERSRDRNHSRESDRKDRRRESPRRADRERHRDARDNRSPRREDRYNRSDRNERGRGFEASQGSARRGLLGDRPDDRGADGKVPALMDLKPFGGEPPPGIERGASQDARDAVSPRFVDRDRRVRGDRGDRAERERDRDRHGRRSEETRPSHRHAERRDRSRERERGAAFPPPPSASTSSSSSAERGDRRGSPPSGDYRPSSYKVNKKLEVMEKMGLQIKTPDGSMATAQQLRAAAGDAPPRHHTQYFNPGALNTNKILDQVQKRKLLWARKRAETEDAGAPPAAAAQWSGARFAQDNDGRQASKFMRLMGIKDPAAVKPDKPASGDGMKKQEELFQAMQAQYDVARATTHTMRGVGLGFSRNQY